MDRRGRGGAPPDDGAQFRRCRISGYPRRGAILESAREQNRHNRLLHGRRLDAPRPVHGPGDRCRGCLVRLSAARVRRRGQDQTRFRRIGPRRISSSPSPPSTSCRISYTRRMFPTSFIRYPAAHACEQAALGPHRIPGTQYDPFGPSRPWDPVLQVLRPLARLISLLVEFDANRIRLMPGGE